MRWRGGDCQSLVSFGSLGYSDKVPIATGMEAEVEFALDSIYKGRGGRREQQRKGFVVPNIAGRDSQEANEERKSENEECF